MLKEQNSYVLSWSLSWTKHEKNYAKPAATFVSAATSGAAGGALPFPQLSELGFIYFFFFPLKKHVSNLHLQ